MAQLPSQTHDNFWVSASDRNITATYPNQDGKWMMFFPMSEMDARWTEASQLYYSGRLTGVNSMKASTAKQNPMPERLHGPNEGIIIFYCGPCEDRANVLRYGRNILSNMHYPSTFYYKSDLPHLINHNKIYKHMYSLNSSGDLSQNDHEFGYSASLQKSQSFNNFLIQPKVPSVYEPNFHNYDDNQYLKNSSNLDYFYNNQYDSGVNIFGFNNISLNNDYSGFGYSGFGFDYSNFY